MKSKAVRGMQLRRRFLVRRILKVNFESMVRSKWPAEMLAASRTPKETARVR